MNEEAALDLAGDRALRLRRKWAKEGRPAEYMARMMLLHGAFWLAELKGETTVAASLEIVAERLRETRAAPPDSAPTPARWWQKFWS